ncbi:lysozyme family protein [Pontibaca methylaminivorans]|uniref:Uncharacterized protein n=1 Tax=Pontibaca methylaminivorans TaxID=515897 RepID=A0A1R3WAJ2_9RHOB|nr:hypothetical protein [Pontibaca methylaminivorans]SIT74820.1 hypothetical protein SAMN05421849_0217 [Pontibaca methylaminivorans]
MKPVTAAHFAPLLALIRKVEARSDYDIVYLGIPANLRPPKALTSMTIAEVMAWQSTIRPRVKSTAAGAYQFIAATLRDAVAGTRIDTARRFDPTAQDELALWLLTSKRGVDRYLRGEISANMAMTALAQEWASLPVPLAMQGSRRRVNAGQSYYAGDGLNKALVSISDVRAALEDCRALYGAATVAPPATTTTSPVTYTSRPLVALLALAAVIAAAVWMFTRG